MVCASFVKDGKAYIVTLDGEIYEVYKDGDDFKVERVADLSE